MLGFVTDSNGLFDLIGGLPVHPLIVHVAVIVLPAAALALIVIVLLPRSHRLVRWGVVAALAVGALSVWVAAESGEALSDRVGEAAVHEALAENLPVVAAVTLALGVIWAVIVEISARSAQATTSAAPSRGLRVLRVIASAATVAIAAYAIYLTIVVGHSGAVATWLPRVGG